MPKTCQHPNCDTNGSYGFPRNKQHRWCKAHRPDGAEDVVNRRCLQCKRQPCFGVPGESPKWCKAHRPEGTEDLLNNRCKANECKLRACFGVSGEKPQWCSRHKPDEVEDIVNIKCEHCKRAPVFGLPGTKRRRWCAEHRPEGATDIVNKRCEHCDTVACFGMPGERPEWCSRHKPAEAVDLRSRRCAFPECDLLTKGTHKYCASHDTERRRKTRVRENQVANYLRDQGFHWTSWNKQVQETACGRYRPDFAYELNTHVVLVEVDEFQHARPGYSCDAARMLDIFGAYGGQPVVFIRFNPDAFKLGGVTKRMKFPTRLRALDTQLRAALAQPPPCQLTIVRLFYDDPQGTVSVSWVAPDDPSFTEHPIAL